MLLPLTAVFPAEGAAAISTEGLPPGSRQSINSPRRYIGGIFMVIGDLMEKIGSSPPNFKINGAAGKEYEVRWETIGY